MPEFEAISARTRVAQGGCPERIVLGVRPGAAPSPKPPVRIYLGSEPAQYRAERVFFWSIERVRDPGRVVEIYLMKDLPGFRRIGWNTAFTNYRFAIPGLAGGRGRAIYNDVDQIYLADPAELFDTDLGDHGYRAVSRTDTSVMLLDCARMVRFWTLPDAQRRRKYGLIGEALDEWGPLGGEWNARDDEYDPETSKLLHYTVLHRQPWHPFPERFAYQPNPLGGIWHELEREADEAGYQPFSAERPSHAWTTGRRGPRPRPTQPRRTELERWIEQSCVRAHASTRLDACARPADAGEPGHEIEELGACVEQAASAPTHDAVVCTSGLEGVPPTDAAWVVERLFARARRLVLLGVACPAPARTRPGRSPEGTVGRAAFWRWVCQSAAARHPAVHWEIAYTEGEPLSAGALKYAIGGPWIGDAAPRVWVLTDHKPGHTTQGQGLAEALGWPFELIQLDTTALADAPVQWLGGSRLGLSRAGRARIEPPWPDLVIATGRRAAPVAGYIREQSGGRTRTVSMGRMGSRLNEELDLAVAPAYADLYPDERRIDTVLPITRVHEAALEAAATRWKGELERGSEPRIAVLVGGGSPEHRFTPEAARELGEGIAQLARRSGGSVFVTTSRRTPETAADALLAALGETVVHFHRWAPDQDADTNPYMGYLALADVLVATGDSASMLAEATATGRPLIIWPLPRSSEGVFGIGRRAIRSVARAIRRRAFARPVNRRGIERPQRGLERFCARLLADGWLHPSSDIGRLHESLIEAGLARPFDGTLELRAPHPYHEAPGVAARVRQLLGFAERKRTGRTD